MIADVLLPYKSLLLHIIGIWDCLKSKTEFDIFSLSIFFPLIFFKQKSLTLQALYEHVKNRKKIFHSKGALNCFIKFRSWKIQVFKYINSYMAMVSI